jgi:hypothetical protein
MTPRERVLAALHGEKTDQVPFTIYEAKIPQCSVERKLRNDGMCIVNRRTMPYVVESPNCVTEGFSYAENGRPRNRAITHTPAGDLSVVTEPAGFTSWTIERLFKGPEDYAKLLFTVKDQVYRANYEAFARAQEWMGDDVILRAGVGSTPLHQIMIHWMGVETFAIEWAERRDEILKLEGAMRAQIRNVYPLIADSPATHANYGGNEVPEVMGPVRFREFCVPLYNECAEFFRPKGKLLGSHLDGNNAPWASDVAKSGLDYVEAFTPTPDTDMTLEDALKAWPDKVLWINFPSSLHLASVEKIRQTTRELIECARGTNRLIIGITEDIPPDRWQQNLLAISEVIREMR